VDFGGNVVFEALIADSMADSDSVIGRSTGIPITTTTIRTTILMPTHIIRIPIIRIRIRITHTLASIRMSVNIPISGVTSLSGRIASLMTAGGIDLAGDSPLQDRIGRNLSC